MYKKQICRKTFSTNTKCVRNEFYVLCLDIAREELMNGGKKNIYFWLDNNQYLSFMAKSFNHWVPCDSTYLFFYHDVKVSIIWRLGSCRPAFFLFFFYHDVKVSVIWRIGSCRPAIDHNLDFHHHCQYSYQIQEFWYFWHY